jgi:hypothetical protein
MRLHLAIQVSFATALVDEASAQGTDALAAGRFGTTNGLAGRGRGVSKRQ